MKVFNWNNEKNQLLKQTRGICFEDILFFIEKGYLLADYHHPNQKDYPGQRLMVVNINHYAYLVPYVENDTEIFLKTIIPSRKATKMYLGENNE